MIQMKAEEAVGGAPGLQEGLTLFEERGDPTISDMGIEGRVHVIDHPEDGLAALGLAEVIALRCMAHLLCSEFAGSNEGLEEVEVIGTTGRDHLHRGHDEVHGVARVVRVKWCTHQVTFDHLNVEADFTANRLV
jgi:hypothetical protein